MAIYIYNSLTKNKEQFFVKNNTVNMYVCGPTVYDYLHLGNFRGVIFFNLVYNFLKREGYDVNFAYNYTDVDDKIIQKAKELNKPALEVSEFFIKKFQEDFKKLKLSPHTYNPKVSDYIPQMIQYIQSIMNRNLAYESNGSVYLRRHKLPAIGILSGRNIDDGLTGDKNELKEKEHPSDFALWKKSKIGEIFWSSPWGDGRPGWHLECSVMIDSIFKGQTLDIHGGGLDLLFPHHENECAQCLAYGQSKLANIWMHNNMLNFDGAKMSKSLGNVQTGRSFMEQHSAELLKFIILSHHYRSVIDFGDKQVFNLRNQMAKIYSTLKKVSVNSNLIVSPSFNNIKLRYLEALRDDFNTPVVLSLVYEAINNYNKDSKKAGDLMALMKLIQEDFSLFTEDYQEFSLFLDAQDLKLLNLKEEEILYYIHEREQARLVKDFKKSDMIRENLKNKGIALLDQGDKTSWEIIRS